MATTIKRCIKGKNCARVRGWGDPCLNPKNYNLRSITLIGEDPMINIQ